jgi:antitoxin HicB
LNRITGANVIQQFSYPVTLKRDPKGGFVVTFKDVPEAITQGENLDDALEQAADALEEAVAGRLRLGEEIPVPSKAAKHQPLVPLPAVTASKAALYMTIRQTGLSKVALAAQLGCDEKEVRRLLNPDHGSKFQSIEGALELLGKRIVVSVEDKTEIKKPALMASGNR